MAMTKGKPPRRPSKPPVGKNPGPMKPGFSGTFPGPNGPPGKGGASPGVKPRPIPGMKPKKPSPGKKPIPGPKKGR